MALGWANRAPGRSPARLAAAPWWARRRSPSPTGRFVSGNRRVGSGPERVCVRVPSSSSIPGQLVAGTFVSTGASWRRPGARATEARAVTLGPAALAGAHLAADRRGRGDGGGPAAGAFSPNIKERADCSAALFTADGELLVQAEHIPVHLGSMPASVRAAIDAFGGRHRARRSGGAERPVRRRDPPERRHAGGPVPRRRTPGRAGPPTAPTTPTSAGPPRLDPGRRHRDPAGGAAHPAHAARRRAAPPLLANSRTPTSGSATSPPRRAPTWSASSGWPRWRTPRSPRSSTTASAACEPRSPTSPTGPGGRATCSTRPGPPRPAASRPDRRRRHGGRRRGHRSTSPGPTRRHGAT